MRVLIVTQYFWPESFRINDLVLGLKDRGHEVGVLTGMPNYPSGRFFPGYGMFSPSYERFHDIPVWRVPLLPRARGRPWQLGLNYLSFAISASLLAPFKIPDRFDLIFVFEPSPISVGFPAVLLKKLRGLPIIFWVQDLWPESLSATGAIRSRIALRGIAKATRFIYRNCDKVLVQSAGFASNVIDVGVHPDTVSVLPNWAESFYQPVAVSDDASERHELPEGFKIVFAGNLGTAQSFETILSAAEILKENQNIHWVIIGDGYQKQWIESEVRRLRIGHSVHLLGWRPAEAMPTYFALADGLLVSLRKAPIFSLTIPSKIQSYMACARPIIGSLDGESAKIIDQAGAGLVSSAEDAQGLAESVLALYKMGPAERQEMGQQARGYYESHFERNQLIQRLENWMNEVVGESK